jgi:hypothetical protein
MEYAVIVEIDRTYGEITLFIYKGDVKIGEIKKALSGDKRIGDRYTLSFEADGHDRNF